jgi:hypothetical protein
MAWGSPKISPACSRQVPNSRSSVDFPDWRGVESTSRSQTRASLNVSPDKRRDQTALANASMIPEVRALEARGYSDRDIARELFDPATGPELTRTAQRVRRILQLGDLIDGQRKGQGRRGREISVAVLSELNREANRITSRSGAQRRAAELANHPLTITYIPDAESVIVSGSPRKAKIQRSFQIPTELWEDAVLVARRRQESLSQVVIRALHDYVGQGR